MLGHNEPMFILLARKTVGLEMEIHEQVRKNQNPITAPISYPPGTRQHHECGRVTLL